MAARLRSQLTAAACRTLFGSFAGSGPALTYRHREIWGAFPQPPLTARGVAHFASLPQPSFASCEVAAVAAAERQCQYRVSVVTGNVRGAGTHASAFVKLVGADGESERFILGDTEDTGFTRASRRVFDVLVPRDLGPIKLIHVERERGSVSDVGDGWYLEKVEVEGPRDQRYLFPCNAWFGHSDCGGVEGPLDRHLLPMAADAVITPRAATPVRVRASGASIPHPDKVSKGGVRGLNRAGFGYAGEDAYFHCHGSAGVFGMGVADGVYAWKELGIDSGRFSRVLIETAQHAVAAGVQDVLRVLSAAARTVESEGVQGSSTLCLLTVDKSTGQLQAANLGDSGFFLIGPKGDSHQLGVKYRTTQLEHEFGCPYQLGHHARANKVSDAELASLAVAPGDVLVMGSDGLFDNLTEHEILEDVRDALAAGMGPSGLVQRLVRNAYQHSVDRSRSTPYSLAATEAFDMVYSGGKPDDLTVVVAVMY